MGWSSCQSAVTPPPPMVGDQDGRRHKSPIPPDPRTKGISVASRHEVSSAWEQGYHNGYVEKDTWQTRLYCSVPLTGIRVWFVLIGFMISCESVYEMECWCLQYSVTVVMIELFKQLAILPDGGRRQVVKKSNHVFQWQGEALIARTNAMGHHQA